jgi:hypothetical protein
LKKNSPLFEDLDDILTEFNNTFGEIDRVQTATIKFCFLRQGSCPALVYVVDFRQLACDVNWDDIVFISVFWWGLRNGVKNLLLNLHDPLTLTKLLHNRLFEC